MPIISIAIPIYNEEENLRPLYARLCAAVADIPEDAEFVFADDGSHDMSFRILSDLAKTDARVKAVRLSRNFGHQAACTAAIRYAQGDAVILMDGDLQDPPELIPQLLTEWRAGRKVVLAKRKSRDESLRRKLLFAAFYRVFGWLSDTPIPPDAGVFSLLDRAAARQLAQFSERNRYIPGLRWWVGFPQGEVWYDRDARLAGEPKQTFRRLGGYALSAIFSFSYKPLRLAAVLGMSISGLCITYASGLAICRILGVNVVKGFTTQAVATLFLGGMQLTFIGILGEYMARIYDEVKQRPLYVVRELVGLQESVSEDGAGRVQPPV